MTQYVTQSDLSSATQLYLGFFGRQPDVAGLYYWSSQISQGITPLQVANHFAESQEFAQHFSQLSAAEQVYLVYQNVLERAPDAEGLDYWTLQLQSGRPIGDVVWSIVNAAFTQQNSPDGFLVQGKVSAALSLMSSVILDIANSSWSASSGYGVINVASALSSILGITIEQGAKFYTSTEHWPINVLNFDDAWAAGYSGDGVVVAVIDTGLDLNNRSLTQELSPHSWNFISQTSNVQDDNGHGTVVASQIISRPVEGNLNGLRGGAYDAELMVLKAMDSSGSGTSANVVAAIRYAVDRGADVINLSLGGGPYDPILFDALSYAAKNGVIVVMAAGNSGSIAPQYPAAYAQGIDALIAVGAVKQNTLGNIVWSLSSNASGTAVPYNFVAAPGAEVPGYGLNNMIKDWSGTSVATPLVTAAIANLLSANSGLQAELIVNALVNTSVELIGLQGPLI